MKYTVVIGPDLAGQNIKQFLEEFGMSYHEISERNIFAEHCDKDIEGDVLIFATTHRSGKGVQSLTVHMPGNWSSNDLGGEERTLCVAPASLIRALYLSLKEKYDGEVSLEVDHHGPTLEKPACFIEIGSSEEEWKNPKMGKLIAEVLRDVLSQDIPVAPTVLALGGGHYPHEANKLLERTEYAVAHICPKHQLEHLDEAMVRQALEKSVEKVEFVVLDWKGMGKEKKRVLAFLEEMKITTKKFRELF